MLSYFKTRGDFFYEVVKFMLAVHPYSVKICIFVITLWSHF